MPKIKTYAIAWAAPADADVVGYNLRWNWGAAPTGNETPFFVNGKATTTLTLPVTGMQSNEGQLYISLTAIDDVGNESDPAVLNFPFDIAAPAPPTNLRLL
jgi:hypothetical protein